MATINVTPTRLSEIKNTLHPYTGTYDTYEISAENLSNLSIIVKTTPGQETPQVLENVFIIIKKDEGYVYDEFTFGRDEEIEIVLDSEQLSKYVKNNIIECKYQGVSSYSSYEVVFRELPVLAPQPINVQVTVTEGD